MKHVLPFYQSHNSENQNFEKIKKAYHKLQSYDVRLLRYEAQQTYFFFHFESFFALFTQLTTKKSKFKKTEKITWRYLYFTQAYQKY